ncbi:MAG: hypothetical protein ACOC1K_07400 [Nanoarchaeota archaeon]
MKDKSLIGIILLGLLAIYIIVAIIFSIDLEEIKQILQSPISELSVGELIWIIICINIITRK